MAEATNQSPIKRQFLFNPLKRPMPYIGLILGLLIIVFQGSIRTYTSNVVGGWLVSSIQTSTQGNYKIEYDFVRFDIFTKELRIKNLNLKLDSAVITPEDYLQDYSNLIDLSTPIVVLKIESLWDLIFNDKLAIVYIGLEQPRVNLIRSPHLSEEESQVKRQQTTEQIRSYLQAIEIDSFRIANGSVQIQMQDRELGQILNYQVANYSTVLRGFQLSNIDPDKPFQGIYVDDIKLEVKDQQLSLPRLNHNLSFKKLWLSSEDSTLIIDSLTYVPIRQDSTRFSGNVFLPQLAIQALDFRKIYETSSLDIGLVQFADLDVELSKLSSGEEIFASTNILSKLPFKDYSIDTISVVNSKLNLDFRRHFRTDNLNLELRNFSLDSSELSFQKLLDNIRDFDLDLAATRLELPDSIHEAYIRSINISSNKRDIKMRGIRVNPISERRLYSLYKKQGSNVITYGNAGRIELNGIRFSELLSNHQLLADSLRIFSPSANMTYYPYITRPNSDNKAFNYLIEHLEINNGRVNFNRRQNATDNRTELMGITLALQGLYPESAKIPSFDQLELSVEEGYSDIKEINHRIKFNNLRSRNLMRFDLSRFEVIPDSAITKMSTFSVSGTGFSLVGYTRDFLSDLRFVELEEVSAQTMKADINLIQDTLKSNSGLDLRQLVINRFYFNDADVNFKTKNLLLGYTNLSSFVDSLHYSSFDTVSAIPIRFKDLQLSHGKFNLTTLGDTPFQMSGEVGTFSETDSLISFSELQYQFDDQLDGSLKKLEIKGFDRDKYLKSRVLNFDYALLNEHRMDINTNSSDNNQAPINMSNSKIRETLLGQFKGIRFDSLIYQNGNIELISKDRNTRFIDSNIKLIDYQFDSSTAITDILQPKEFNINISALESIGFTDSTSINGLNADLVKRRLMTGKVTSRMNLPNGDIINTTSPGISASGMSLSNILQKDYSLDTLLVSSTSIQLVSTDSTKDTASISSPFQEVSSSIGQFFSRRNTSLLDTVFRTSFGLFSGINLHQDSGRNLKFQQLISQVQQKHINPDIGEDSLDNPRLNTAIDTIILIPPTNGIIGYLGMNNANFSLVTNNEKHHALGDIDFSLSIEHVILDSLNEFSAYDHVNDLRFSVRNYNYTFKDSLNRLGFRTLNYSSKDEKIKINGIHLSPLVSKYEYAPILGRQVGWHHLKDLDIEITRLDLDKLINEQVILVDALTTNGGVLDIFKDKELPIPVNQYRPMLQDGIKNIDIPFNVDSLVVDNFEVHFTSRLSSDMPEGSLSLYEISGKSGHINNIDTLLFKHPNLNLKASTKIMNKGLLNANFSFNMLDPENGFSFDARLNSMSAKDFNSLLEATAYVSVQTGQIKDIELAASANDSYALGKMTFQYNNLTVSTLNKKNFQPTGMGRVIKTFFANAFVVKKNNPSIKFFPREGNMFYERNTQKIIIDYIVKTAMSGVVSSIGARNFRKEIRQIQKDSQKQLDEQNKAKKKAEKLNSIP